MKNENRKRRLRRQKTDAREALTREERSEKSAAIVSHILGTETFRKARTVMIYRSVRGEVQLEKLPMLATDKCYAYPLCVSRTRMLALSPGTGEANAWKKGAFGIPEPNPAYSREVSPEEIDLVICPCTSFDREGNRLGMGAGYYDRFLKDCVNADIIAVAFAVQEAKWVPTDEYDVRMRAVITEDGEIPCRVSRAGL